MARGFLERADAVAEGCGSGVDGCRFFNFGYESGTDDRGVSKTTQNRDMPGKRNAEADGDGKLRDVAGAAQECREIVGQSILRAGDAGARDEIEKPEEQAEIFARRSSVEVGAPRKMVSR